MANGRPINTPAQERKITGSVHGVCSLAIVKLGGAARSLVRNDALVMTVMTADRQKND